MTLKNDVNVPSKSKKQKNLEKNSFLLGALKVNDENSKDPEPDPDPFVRGTDPWVRILIRANMSRIRNTSTEYIL